MQSPVMGLYDC